MTCTKKQCEDKTVLELEGRLDTTTAPGFEVTLIDTLEDSTDLVLDCSQLSYVSSAGLRTLLSAQKISKKTGKSMTLKHVSEEVMGVFQMTGFSEILKFE